MARPPKAQEKINQLELKDLCKFYPSEKEAADWFDVSISSLRRFIKRVFRSSFDQLRDKSFVRTRIGIKRAQIKKALEGDNTMLIWCGKQYLGQTDKVEEKKEISGQSDVVFVTSWAKPEVKNGS